MREKPSESDARADGPPAGAETGAAADGRAALEQGLVAQLSEHQFRGLRLGGLRLLALASLPLWLGAYRGRLPDPLGWLAIVGQTFCMLVVIVCAISEHWWTRRAALVQGGRAGAVHLLWSAYDEARSGLWFGFAVVSLVPWISAVAGRRLPHAALMPLAAVAGCVLALAVGADARARRRMAGPRGGPRGAP